MSISRRSFVSSAAAGVAGGLVAGTPVLAQTAASRQRVLGANDRIRIGSIGVGGMGRSHLNNFQQHDDVQIVTVCDVWDVNRRRAQRMTEKQTGGAASMEADYRRVIDRQDLDAVIVATVDHWHAIPMMLACQSGKDVYVEKPISHNVTEGRAMVAAARKFDRVVQVGTQQRSGLHFQEAIRIVQSGALGTIHRIHAWNVGNQAPAGLGRPANGAPPAGLDWDAWLGPAPVVPFNANRFIFQFRWFWDYAGGMMTDWGVHLLDLALWGMQQRAPKTVYAVGGNFVLDDNRETPDTIDAIYEFPGFVCTYSNRSGNAYNGANRGYGVEFYGTDATLFLDRSGFEVIPETAGTQKVPTPSYLSEQQPSLPVWKREWAGASRARTAAVRAPSSDQNLSHIRNFLDCMRSRQRPNSDVELGHLSTAMCLLGNVAYRTGRKLTWDADKELCVDDAAANALLTREYRAPYTLPQV
ncbi:MAG: Gfo/Idh/MocA family oxidoreductase [Acidobacteria bacterium]|nr:Gfo/Idh/MocA family oxidoreductase [Acidobacteriota bacterium]